MLRRTYGTRWTDLCTDITAGAQRGFDIRLVSVVLLMLLARKSYGRTSDLQAGLACYTDLRINAICGLGITTDKHAFSAGN